MYNRRAAKHYRDTRVSLAVDLVVHCTGLLRLSRPLLAATMGGKVPPLETLESFMSELHDVNATLQSLQGYWSAQIQEQDIQLFAFGRAGTDTQG